MIVKRTSSRKATIVPEKLLPELFLRLAQDLGLNSEAPVLHAHGLLTSRKYLSFLSLTDAWTTQQYGSAGETLAWHQLACLLKKYPFVDPSIDKEGAAMKKFYAAEHRCRRVNARFRARRRRCTSRPYEAFLERARAYIVRVIGEEPRYSEIWNRCDFGPGASVGIHGNATHSARKLSERFSVTPACVPFAFAALSSNAQVWEALMGQPYCLDPDALAAACSSRTDLVSANKIVLVPKTAKVHRTIAVEPSLNGFVQKGVDKFMRSRLRAHGLDLSDQTLNQHLARLGSEDSSNPFATIDLSAASDSISIELCRELLPPSWFSFLNCIRSPEFTYAGKTTRYEKFASMGNGFCFPLETLIFASIVHSVYVETGDTVFRVYGDDIVVRQSSALLVLEVLRYCGFSANADKTFVFGPFRESCGADYFRGVNVRPYYIDEIPIYWDDIFKWLNGLRRTFGETSAWLYLLGQLPADWRLLRPFDGPDDSITTELDTFMASPFARFDRRNRSWRYKRLRVQPRLDPASYDVKVLMYGVLNGLGSHRYQPALTLRRETRTRLEYSF